MRSKSGWWKTGEHQSLGANRDSSCQGDWWPCQTWILPGEIGSHGSTMERWRFFHSVLQMGSSQCSQGHIVGIEAFLALEEGNPVLSTKYPLLISLGLIWGPSPWHQRNSEQCLGCEPCSLGNTSFYILASALLKRIALVSIIQARLQRYWHFKPGNSLLGRLSCAL